MAGSARRIVVEFLGDDKTLGKTMGDVDGKSNKLMGTLGKVGKAAALGLGAGLLGAAVAGTKFVKSAAEDQQAAALLEGALKRNANATDQQVATVESWISAQGRATGVADDDLRPALSRLVTATGDVTKAQELARLSMEVSAGTGKSLEQVSTALMKAQNGQVSSLSRLGINTKNAAGETITFEQAVARMGDTFAGAAAEKANTFQGKMDRLKLILSETGETIGSKLLPVVTSMADWFLSKGVPAMMAFGGYLQTNVLPVLQRMGQWITANVVPALQKMGDWIGAHVLPVLQRLGSEGPSIFSRLRAAIEPVIQTVISIAQNVAGKLRPVFEAWVDTVRSKVLPAAKQVIERFQEWWPTISKVVSKLADLGATIIGTVLPPVIRFAGYLISTLVPRVLDTIEVIGKIIGKVVAVGGAFVDGIASIARWVGGVREKIGNALDTIQGIPDKAKAALSGIGSSLLEAGRSLIQGLIDGITEKVSALRDKLQSVTKLIPDWKGPLDKDKVLLTPAGEALIEGLIAGIDKKKTKLQSVLEKITDHIKKKQDDLAALLDRRQSIVDSFRGMAGNVFGQDTSSEGSPASVQKLLDFQANQRARAQQLSTDVGTLVGKGLSKDLIQKLIDSGAQGMDQIRLLADATDAQIRELGVLNQETQDALAAAGLKASDALIGAAITQAQADVALADTIRDKLRELLDEQDKNTIVQLILDGKVLHASLKRLKRESGKKLELD